MRTDLSKYDNSWYKPGSALKRIFWYFFQVIFIKSRLFPFSGSTKALLRLFGAKIGNGVVIKPGVNIKYPWNLEIGDHSWVGEDVWIDNLAKVRIGNNVCISQGAMLECGDHDYTKPTFDLRVNEIILEDGVWICAQAFVSGGTQCKSHSVLTARSTAPKLLEGYSIYSGIPAIKIKERVIS
ncbi:MAG: colanic acid biosynthesis acetyltransferase WcaF [Flavobacteriales bacterium]|nr:colanic acid biosynthesis acetyltransferase WcaF [Flavobacteriales bacterium]